MSKKISLIPIKCKHQLKEQNEGDSSKQNLIRPAKQPLYIMRFYLAETIKYISGQYFAFTHSPKRLSRCLVYADLIEEIA